MKRWSFAMAVVLVGMLLACGPKKPFAQEKLSAISSKLLAGAGAAQAAAEPQASEERRRAIEEQKAHAVVKVLECGTLIDGRSDQPRKRVDVVIENNRIREIRPGGTGPGWTGGVALIDLTNQTCLPGLMDTHTHVLLQGDITAEDYDVQLLKQSNPYRAIVGAATAGKALNYGFTTIRDVETEGAGYSDVDIKKAINNGIVPGPRMQVATRALDVTGAYPLQGYNWELRDIPHGVQFCDGADDCRKAVREQISHGADWIKLYSDRSYYLESTGRPGENPRPVAPNPGATRVGQPSSSELVLKDVPTFTMEELRAIVDEAHRER